MVPPLLRVDWSAGSGSAFWRRRRSILRARLHCRAAMTNRDAAFVYALPLPDRARLGSTTRAAARWRRQRAATTPRRPCTASSWLSPSGCSCFCGCCRRTTPGLHSAARDRACYHHDERTHVDRVARPLDTDSGHVRATPPLGAPQSMAPNCTLFAGSCGVSYRSCLSQRAPSGLSACGTFLPHSAPRVMLWFSFRAPVLSFERLRSRY